MAIYQRPNINIMSSVSVIIPVYRVEVYLADCVKSVLNQTFHDYEVILVDDGSPDHCPQLCDEWAEKDSRISVIHRENGGLSAARNTGVKAAKGDYLYFLDSDDELTPDALEVMYKQIETHPQVDLVQGGFFEKKEDAGKSTPYNLPEYTEDAKLIKNTLLTFDGDLIKAQSRLVRRDFFIENELWFKEGIIHEDNYWTFFLAKCVKTMCFCNKRTYYHRMNPDSITHAINVKKEYNAFKVILEDFCNNIDDFLVGRQKELILETLVVALNKGCISTKEERRYLIELVKSKNNFIENILLKLYLRTYYPKVLHLLVRIYKR